MTVFLITLTGGPAAAAWQPLSGDDRARESQAERPRASPRRKTSAPGREIADGVFLSGVLEVEAFYEDLVRAEGHRSESDIVLATVELGFDVRVTDSLTGTVLLAHENEQKDKGLSVDEAFVDYRRGGLRLRLGLQDLPTGAFRSNMISGPLTEELGETREAALLLGYATPAAGVRAFVYRGEADAQDGHRHLDDWGVAAHWRPAPTLAVSGSFFSSLAGTGEDSGDIPGGRIAGWSASCVLSAGDFEVLAEVVGALERFGAADLDSDEDGRGDRPFAWNSEVTWEASDTIEVTVRVEGSREFTGEPELQYGPGVSWSPWESVTLSIEYLRGRFDRAFGEGAERRDLVTTQVAVEF